MILKEIILKKTIRKKILRNRVLNRRIFRFHPIIVSRFYFSVGVYRIQVTQYYLLIRSKFVILKQNKIFILEAFDVGNLDINLLTPYRCRVKG